MLHFMVVKKTKYRGSINESNQEGLPSNLKGKTLHLIKFRFQQQSIFYAGGDCQNNCKTKLPGQSSGLNPNPVE